MGQPGKKTAYLTAAVGLLVLTASAILFGEKIRLQLYRWHILPHPALLNPSLADEKAPEKFKARFVTTQGDFVIAVTREWAPQAADRFYNLIEIGYFTEIAFFRVINGFMAQFGISGNPQINAKWSGARIPDDPVKHPNSRGHVSFACAGPNTRTTQLFINYADNSRLDGMGFSPFGVVTQGME